MTTADQLLINSVLPPDLRRPDHVLDKKGIQKLLQEVADKHPDKFSQVLFDLSRIGHRVAYDTGGHSFGLAHLRPTAAARATQGDLGRQVQALYADPATTADQKRTAVTTLLGATGEPMQKQLYGDSLAEDNPLAMQVASGARGNQGNLRSLRGGDLMYVDHRNRPIPVPVLRSYAQGLSPAEYLAGSFGARKGVVDTKLCLSYDSQVLMADYSVRVIRDVRVGEMVMGADKAGSTFPVRVTNVFDNGLRTCYRYRFYRGSQGSFLEVTATEDHQVLAWPPRISRYELLPLETIRLAGGWVPVVANLELVSTSRQGEEQLLLAGRAANRELVGEVSTFDLEVDHPDHLFVLANGLIVSNSVMSSGFLAKQMTQASHRLVVTDLDGDGEPDVVRGLPVDVSDPDNEGALLAAPAGGYPRNTVLTPKILADLRSKVDGDILVRSPMVGGPASGGVYGRDVGIRERGGIPSRGDFVGIAAAQGLGEPLSQSQLCLAEGTLVRMADGSERAIELLKTGDLVLGAWVPPRRLFEVCQPSLEFGPVAVIRRYDNGVRACVTTRFERVRGGHGIELTATVDHKVLAKLVVDDESDESRHEQAYSLLPLATGVAALDETDFLVKVADLSGPDRYDTLVAAKAKAAVELRETGMDLPDWLNQPVPESLRGCINSHLSRLTECESAGPRPAFDIEVDHAQHMFVLANGLIVSNSSKHAGGVAGASKGVSGFALINQLVQTPKSFAGGAAHASKDGRITGIRPAPQGGSFISVDGVEHHVGTGLDPTVKVGDEVEAGDVLSEGTPNPAEIVRHKGIGEGRRYFVQAFKAAYDGAGIPSHRRNVELVARGLIDHVRMTDETDDHLPDDVVPYSRLEAGWRSRDGHTVEAPRKAKGMYLDRPVLHYSIGTRVTPSVISRLERHGVAGVTVHADPPPFEPEMIRGVESLSKDPDWMTRMMGAYQQKSLLRGVHRGSESDEAGTSYVPPLARARDFGRIGDTVGFATSPTTSTPPHPRSLLDGLLGNG